MIEIPGIERTSSMPVIQEVMDALEKIGELHKRKNEDYATNSNPFSNFDVQAYFIDLFHFASPHDQAFVSLISVKIARLANLLSGDKEPKNESIEDTMLDLATYALIWRAHIIQRNKTWPNLSVPGGGDRVQSKSTS